MRFVYGDGDEGEVLLLLLSKVDPTTKIARKAMTWAGWVVPNNTLQQWKYHLKLLRNFEIFLSKAPRSLFLLWNCVNSLDIKTYQL